MLWLLMAVVLGIIESITVQLITIWFAIGALAAFSFSMAGFSLEYQLLAFIVCSGIMLYFTKPLVKKFLHAKNVPTNADRVIGQKGIVIQASDEITGIAQVKILGQTWSCLSTDRHCFAVGDVVEVLEISGVKLVVKCSDLPVASH